jgi:hypothetical protein
VEDQAAGGEPVKYVKRVKGTFAVPVSEDQCSQILDALVYAQAVSQDPGWSADIRILVNDLFQMRCHACDRLLELADPDGEEPRWLHMSKAEAMDCQVIRAPGEREITP